MRNELSEGERRALNLLIEGITTNKDIANELNVSTRTVEGIFSSIFQKVGASSKIETLVILIKNHKIGIKIV